MSTGDGPDGGSGAASRTRARDADRDRVVQALEEAFVHGELDATERDARVGEALAARTLGDLDAITTDLQERPARPRAHRPAQIPSFPVTPTPSPAPRTDERWSTPTRTSHGHRSAYGWVAGGGAAIVLALLLGAVASSNNTPDGEFPGGMIQTSGPSGVSESQVRRLLNRAERQIDQPISGFEIRGNKVYYRIAEPGRDEARIWRSGLYGDPTAIGEAPVPAVADGAPFELDDLDPAAIADAIDEVTRPGRMLKLELTAVADPTDGEITITADGPEGSTDGSAAG